MTLRVLGRPAFATRFWNPYNWLLYTHLRKLGVEVDESTRARVLAARHQILHIHWPEQHLNRPSRPYAFGRTLTLLAQLSYLRRRGTRIVWTVHNLAAHDRLYPRFERWFWGALIRRLDGFICLTETSRRQALERFPQLARLPCSVIPHGHYREVYPNTISRCAARERLNVSHGVTVFLLLGSLRPYKNVTQLIDAFKKLEDPDALLIVAGKPWDEKMAREVHEHAAADPRVRPVLAHVPNHDLQIYFGAADVVVLPYREILNSGSAIMALSFDRPVLLPESACGAELQSLVGEEWVRVYEGSLDAQRLAEAREWVASGVRDASPDLSELDWERIAGQTAAFFQQVVTGSGEPCGGDELGGEGPARRGGSA